MMDKTNIDKLVKISSDVFLDGTSARFFAMNTLNNKIGVLKENGCMLGIQNEDVREKLASEILIRCGVPAAEIDLFVDNDNNGYCFSYNVLGENEKHIDVDFRYIVDEATLTHKEKFTGYMDNYFNAVLLLPGMSKEALGAIKKRILAITLVDCIIDHYDRKPSNMKVIYNQDKNEYQPPIAYDYGTAFEPHALQRNGVFYFCTNEEVMAYLFDVFPNDTTDIATNIINNLDNEYLKLLFQQSYLGAIDKEGIKKQILIRQKQLQQLYQDRLIHDKKMFENLIDDITPKESEKPIKGYLQSLKSYLAGKLGNDNKRSY